MDFSAFKDWALLALITGGLYMLVDILKDIRNSIVLLTDKVAVVIEKTNNHEIRIEHLEKQQP